MQQAPLLAPRPSMRLHCSPLAIAATEDCAIPHVVHSRVDPARLCPAAQPLQPHAPRCAAADHPCFSSVLRQQAAQKALNWGPHACACLHMSMHAACRTMAAQQPTRPRHQRDTALQFGVGAQRVPQGQQVGGHGLKGQHGEAMGRHSQADASQVGPHIQEYYVLPGQAPGLQAKRRRRRCLIRRSSGMASPACVPCM